MTEEVKNVHREPHPFVGVPHMLNFVGRTIAFVGKIDRIEEGCLIMTTIERKYILQDLTNNSCVGKEVKIIRYKNDSKLSAGHIVEIRGIVNKDGTISFGEYTQYDTDFDLQAYENMLEYYHGMCKELCVKWLTSRK